MITVELDKVKLTFPTLEQMNYVLNNYLVHADHAKVTDNKECQSEPQHVTINITRLIDTVNVCGATSAQKAKEELTEILLNAIKNCGMHGALFRPGNEHKANLIRTLRQAGVELHYGRARNSPVSMSIEKGGRLSNSITFDLIQTISYAEWNGLDD